MIYRDTGQFKHSYEKDQELFAISQDRWGIVILLVIAFFVIPVFASDYWLQAILIPFLIFSLAALGLNLLTGYAGQLSLGTGGFMAVGAYSCYKLVTLFPNTNVILLILLSGFFSAVVGIIFGLPSLRIKGFYLAVATLAAQFFFEWLFGRVGWFYNYNDSGAIEVPVRKVFDFIVTGPTATTQVRYIVVLSIVVILSYIAVNILRGRIGRSWMAIRDMDIAAELIGIRPLKTKLLAFAMSSFYVGIAGSLFIFTYLGSAEVEVFDINMSFEILFMIIIGGLGSVSGAFMGAAFIVLVPILITNLPLILGIPINAATVEHFNFMILGSLIIVFLIFEPHGLAKIWSIMREKLRVWPFPY
jgi:branched-chain amino acid transport system permease protein